MDKHVYYDFVFPTDKIIKKLRFVKVIIPIFHYDRFVENEYLVKCYDSKGEEMAISRLKGASVKRVYFFKDGKCRDITEGWLHYFNESRTIDDIIPTNPHLTNFCSDVIHKYEVFSKPLKQAPFIPCKEE